MSIEAALAENTAALLKVAGLLEISNAGREAAIAKITGQEGGDAPAAGTRGRKPKATETPAAAAAPTETVKEEPKPAAAAAATPTNVTAEALRDAAKAFLGGAPNDGVKAQRKAFLDAIKDHFGGNTFMEAVPAADYGKVVAWIATKTADIDAKVNFSEGEDEAGDAGADEFDIG